MPPPVAAGAATESSAPLVVPATALAFRRHAGRSAAARWPRRRRGASEKTARAQHLSDVAKALYGPGTDRADAWARQRHDELDDGRLRAIVAELRTHSKTSDAARRCLDYMVRNRRRMRCPRFRAQGLCVSSGAVEVGCKRVVGARLKRAGMRWTVFPEFDADQREFFISGMLPGEWEETFGDDE